jgi:hypothetical protein
VDFTYDLSRPAAVVSGVTCKSTLAVLFYSIKAHLKRLSVISTLNARCRVRSPANAHSPVLSDLQTGKANAQSTTYRYDDSFSVFPVGLPVRSINFGTIYFVPNTWVCFCVKTVTSKRRSHGSDIKQAHVARYFGSSGRVPGRGATRFN